ncbi:MAG: formylglycine-generating enzyme family protein [Desulfotignum sp.]|nr:formylglycine-generating enzyme family protein [Desulfotignum sp.]
MKQYIITIQLIAIILILATGGYAEEPKKQITNSIGMEFVLIPSGSFSMGSPEGEPGRSLGEIQHPVNLTRPFYMQTTEVTQEQWMALMSTNPSSNKVCGKGCPVEQVSWNDVQEFIQKLNQKEGTDKYRLPTEAEWEYACRAGSTEAFPNGGITELGCGRDPNLVAIGWYCGNSNNKVQPVARKKPNSWGLYDMVGNVHEWCQDWFGVYPYDEVTNPKGPHSGSYRVMRGGVWYSPARDCRSASRFGSPPHYKFRHIGFRLAKTP